MKRAIAIVIWCAVLASATLAATPPPLLNYQGVLRDGSGTRLEGTFDMVFRFLDDPDPALPENEILVDSHTTAGANAVTVIGGAFNAALGGGTVTDGTGAGSYTSLADVFASFEPVYVEINVGDEVLSGRIRVLSSAYALNARRLEGLSTGQFLRSDASDTFSSGTLGLDPGTVLNVSGALQISGAAVTSDASELNKLDGAGLTVTAANLTVLTNGGVADGLHTHTNVNAATLDGLDSTAFLLLAGGTMTGALTLNTGANANAVLTEEGLDRQGTTDQTLRVRNTLAGSAILEVDGDVKVGTDSATDVDSVFFDDGINESLAWDDAESRFELSDEVAMTGPLRLGDMTLVAPVTYNRIALGAATPFASGDITLRNDVWIEGDLEVDESLYLPNTLVAGDTSPTTGQAFSSFGEAGGKDEAAVSASSDVYVAGDVEVDGTAFTQVLRITGTDLQGAGSIHLLPPDLSDVVFGDGTTLTPDVDVELAAGGFCVDDDGSCIPPVDGHVKAFVFDAAGHSDVAEIYPSSETLQPGDVVVVDRSADGKIRKSTVSQERGYVSVVSTRPGIVLGGPTDADMTTYGLDPERGPNFGELLLIPGTYPVVLMGRVPVKVSDENGPIGRGDLLTTSSTPGVAMRSTQAGGVLGQALQEWKQAGLGTITAWVMPGVRGMDEAQEGPSSAPAGGAPAARPSNAVLASEPRSAATSMGVTVDPEGNLYARSFRPALGDLAGYERVSESITAGDVVVMDPEHPGEMRRGSQAADPAVVGIAVGEAGFVIGMELATLTAADPELARRLDDASASGDRDAVPKIWQELEKKHTEVRAPIAVSGLVPCKVDADLGAIRVGDLLTTSSTPGHAMRVTEERSGTILGKALESLESGKGTIRVLIMLR